VKIICDEIGPKFASRSGGYTRINRLGPRLGDGAEMVLLELVEQSDASMIAQRRKLIERRQLVESKKEKKTKEKKPKEKKFEEKKSKAEPKETKKEKKTTTTKSSKVKKTKKKSK
jgi:hypothetical protein